MALSINTNIASLTAQGNVNKTQASLEKALERLSSGLRINSAKDDAAGLAISNRMTAQVNGLNQAVSNANDGISLAQTAEGALDQVTSNLQRLRELAVQAANASNSDDDRAALQEEASQLLDEIDRIANDTDFNGITLLDGSFVSQEFQVGANAGQTITISMSSAKTEDLGTDNTAALTAQGTSTAFSEGDLIINGVTIRSSSIQDDTASYPTSSKAASAIAKAAAINASSDETGVTATADENVLEGAYMSGAAGSGTLTINGVAISVTTTDDASASRTSVVEAINAVSGQTGVVAEDTGSDATGVTLTAADGRNITVQFGSPTSGVFDSSSTGITGLDANELAGTSMTAAAGTGYITINGVATALVTTSTDAATSRANVVAAVNAISDQTGVIATDTGDDSLGITLTAADGRHITAEFSRVTGQFDSINTGVSSDKAVVKTGGANITTNSESGNLTITVGSTSVILSGVTLTGTSATDQATILGLINSNSDLQSLGVTAVAKNTSGIQIISANGEALSFAETFATTTLAGLDLAGTYSAGAVQGEASTAEGTDYGSYTLTSASEIVISSGSGSATDLAAIGLVSGTYDPQTAYTSTTSNNGIAISEGDVKINDVLIGASEASSDTYSRYSSSVDSAETEELTAASAIAKVAAINAISDQTGVTATVNENVSDGADMAGGSAGTGTITINGVETAVIGVTDVTDETTAAQNRSSVIDAINAISAQTGVVAVDSNDIGSGVRLIAADGRNINIEFSDGLTSANTGVTGSTVTQTLGGSAMGAAADDSGTVSINGYSVTVSTLSSLTTDQNRDAVAAAINAISSQTGVYATNTGSNSTGVTLSSSDGVGFTVSVSGLSAVNSGLGVDDGGSTTMDGMSDTTFGTYTLSSTTSFSIEKGSTANLESTGLTVGVYGSGKSGMALSDIDLSTAEGASEAIEAIDNALNQVDSSRSILGAVQNRFEATISNLSNISENLTTAASRITDADFAAETANMTKYQVLQQAGVSVLAQANKLPQQLLSLLQQ
ncbi:MAG: flagellin [Syntrophobacteraceae bacterium]